LGNTMCQLVGNIW